METRPAKKVIYVLLGFLCGIIYVRFCILPPQLFADNKLSATQISYSSFCPFDSYQRIDESARYLGWMSKDEERNSGVVMVGARAREVIRCNG